MNDLDRTDARRSLIERQRAIIYRRERALLDERELLEMQEADWEDLAADRSAARLLALLGEHDLDQLRQLDRALERLADGTYGKCVACGGPISAARLHAVPEADLCVGCRGAD